MAVLQALKGLNPGQMFPLDGVRMVMGRHPDCDIVLDVGAVSREHAQITREGDSFFVEDLHSRNGTYVNGELIQGRRQLRDNDRLKICDLLFTFHQAEPIRFGQASEDGSTITRTAMLVDDSEENSGTTIMSKLDVASSRASLKINPEAKLQALIEISQNLANAVGLDKVLPKILESLFKIFIQADRGFVVLRTAENGPLIPKAVHYRRPDADDTVRISRTIVNQVMSSREAILSADAANDERFDMSQSIADFRIRSMLCAPLVDSRGNALGVIQIDTLDQRSRFQKDDLDLLVSVANQAAIAVENAQLHEQTVRQQVLDRDLALAHKVQTGLLPAGHPRVPDYEFFDFYEPANQIGGDFYDYIALPDGRLCVVLADVSGKGISAALVMARLSAEVRYCLVSEATPALAVRRLNATFLQSGWEDRFVTLVLVVIDPARHSVTTVNAGHMAPFLRKRSGEVEAAGNDHAGLPLGVDADYEYEQAMFDLAAGDSLIMFTDGFSEAMNSQRETFGLDRLAEQIGFEADDAGMLGRRILEGVKSFVGAHPQSDDMCLVVVGRAPASQDRDTPERRQKIDRRQPVG